MMRVPTPLARLGRAGLAAGMRVAYHGLFRAQVHGAEHVPPHGGYLVVANHASHLDSGLVKHALGAWGDAMVSLAARDYFFDEPRRRWFFETFTNLVPIERHGSLRESLRLACEVIDAGYVLLIFPEGTRSATGVMADFKPSLGYLAMATGCGILPMYLAGPYDVFPRGARWPRRAPLAAHIGPFVTPTEIAALTAGRGKAQAYRAVAADVEARVRALAPPSHAWTLGDAGLAPLAARAPSG